MKILVKKGVNPEKIYAFDIDNSYKTDLQALGINFTQKDTLLDIRERDHNKFDYIIGNPPYLNKSSNYIKKNKQSLKKIYGHINAHESYAMFIVNNIWRLKEGGFLAFITSDSFLTLRTHTRLREYILKTCQIKEILLAPQNLFEDQGVNTFTSILVLKKFTGDSNRERRRDNLVRIIPRIENEDYYERPPKVKTITQKKFEMLPFCLFSVDLEEEILDLFENAPKLKSRLRGYIGMHTHNNRKFIAAIEGTKLARIFTKRNTKIKEERKKFKIITQKEFKSRNWKPYLKRGGKDQYFRPIMEALKWDEESIKIYDIPKNVPFEEEGIVISGISSRMAARYMPPGCYWDSNKAIGFILKNSSPSIEFFLGLLNSSLYNYLAKGIINNTSSIQISGIHALPIIIPKSDIVLKIERLVKEILEKKKINQNYDYSKEQKLIDNLIFNYFSNEYNFPKSLKQKLDMNYSTY